MLPEGAYERIIERKKKIEEDRKFFLDHTVVTDQDWVKEIQEINREFKGR